MLVKQATKQHKRRTSVQYISGATALNTHVQYPAKKKRNHFGPNQQKIVGLWCARVGVAENEYIKALLISIVVAIRRDPEWEQSTLLQGAFNLGEAAFSRFAAGLGRSF